MQTKTVVLSESELVFFTDIKEAVMVGMLQIITYMLSFYMVIKGCEVLQIGMASSRDSRSRLVLFGVLVLLACIVAAVGFIYMQDNVAGSISNAMK